MTLTFHALWMLCGLGSVVLATAVRTRFAWVALTLGFAATAGWTAQSGRAADAAWIGSVVALTAAWQLVRPDSKRSALVAAACAGVAAASWGSVLQLEGVARLPALAIAGGLALLTSWMTNRRATFAPAELREEALAGIVVLGAIVAAAPAVAQGWQSALALNIADKGAAAPLVPLWTLSFIGASVALGGLWSLWRRG